VQTIQKRLKQYIKKVKAWNENLNRETTLKWKIQDHASNENEWFLIYVPFLKEEGYENMQDLSCKSESEFNEDIKPIFDKIIEKKTS